MRRLPSNWLVFALLAAAMAAGSPYQASAQNDDPFASATETTGASTDSPFTGGAAEPAPSDDPFAESAPGAAAPPPAAAAPAPAAAPPAASGDSPFEDANSAGFVDPAAPKAPDNPFADGPTGATPTPPPPDADPFGNDTGPSDFVAPGRVDLDPFAVDPGTPGSPSQPSRSVSAAVPLGRPELKYEDGRLRRAAEIRGLYVSATGRGMQDSAQLKQLAADFRDGDFNRLYAETRTVYGCLYPSALEPRMAYVTDAFPNPLLEIQPQLGEYGSVVAVVSLLPAYDASVSSRPSIGSMAAKHPDYLSRSLKGDMIAPDNMMYLDPGNPDVRKYLGSLVVEIEKTVHPTVYLFRGLKYPSKEWGYSEAAVAAFRSQVGGSGNPPPDDPVWGAWRRQQIVETIKEIRNQLNNVRPGAILGAEVLVEGPPPANWDSWVSSPTYADHMQDWIGWCRAGVVSEVCFTLHERVQPQGNVLPEWLPFINSNVGEVRPVISLAGNLNRREGIRSQFELTRERAVGNILFNYADPARDVTRGFFQSLRDTLYRGAPGNPVGERQITGTAEDRVFSPMGSPPPSVQASPTPDYAHLADPLAGQKLVFLTPTPQPTRTPAPHMVPEAIVRKLTLRNGRKIEAIVLEASAESLTIKAANQEKAPAVKLQRSSVLSIQPPL